MNKEKKLKILGVVVIAILVLNLILFAFVVTNWIVFWIILALAFVFVKFGLPKIKK